MVVWVNTNSANYEKLEDEALVVNALGVSLVGLALLAIYILKRNVMPATAEDDED